MPNRILRDWTDSDAINSLSWNAEVLFIRLIMKVDDFGRFSASPKLLRSLLFPIRDGIRDADILRWLAECEKSGLIRVYTSQNDAKPLLQIEKFQQRSRAEKSKYDEPPPNDGHVTVSRQPRDGPPLTYSEAETYSYSETKAKAAPDFLLPKGFDSDSVKSAVLDWIEYRKQIKKPLKPLSIVKLIAKWKDIGDSRFVAAVNHSIANSWQGLFEPGGGNDQSGGSSKTSGTHGQSSPGGLFSGDRRGKPENPGMSDNRAATAEYIAKLEAKRAAMAEYIEKLEAKRAASGSNGAAVASQCEAG